MHNRGHHVQVASIMRGRILVGHAVHNDLKVPFPTLKATQGEI